MFDRIAEFAVLADALGLKEGHLKLQMDVGEEGNRLRVFIRDNEDAITAARQLGVKPGIWLKGDTHSVRHYVLQVGGVQFTILEQGPMLEKEIKKKTPRAAMGRTAAPKSPEDKMLEKMYMDKKGKT